MTDGHVPFGSTITNHPLVSAATFFHCPGRKAAQNAVRENAMRRGNGLSLLSAVFNFLSAINAFRAIAQPFDPSYPATSLLPIPSPI
jgi:hypothetical protein